MEQTGINCGRHEVVGGRDGMDVAGQVKVEILHRNHLAVAAASRAALDPEGGALAGLPDAGEHAFVQMRAKSLA